MAYTTTTTTTYTPTSKIYVYDTANACSSTILDQNSISMITDNYKDTIKKIEKHVDELEEDIDFIDAQRTDQDNRIVELEALTYSLNAKALNQELQNNKYEQQIKDLYNKIMFMEQEILDLQQQIFDIKPNL